MLEQTQRKPELGKHGQKPRLWERMKRRMKLFTAKTLMVAGLMGGMAFPASAKADGFSLSAYPGYTYNIQSDSHNPSLRLTGGGQLAGGVIASGIINLNSPDRNSFDLRLSNSELRLHRVFGLFGPGIQYEASSGEDALRAGAVITPPLGEDACLIIRVLPFSFLTQHYGEAKDFFDLKLALYAKMKITDGLSAETYWKWTMASKSIYGEVWVDYMFLDWMSIGAGVSNLFSFEGPDSTTVGGRLGLQM